MGWGTLVGLLAGSYTLFLWHHPYAILTFTLEALIVGWLLHQRNLKDLALADAIYWLVIGISLIWVSYTYGLGLEELQSTLIILKQPINGLINAIIANFLTNYLPWEKWLQHHKSSNLSLSLEQTLANFLIAFIFVPVIFLMIWQGNFNLQQVENRIQSYLTIIANNTMTEMELRRRPYEQALEDGKRSMSAIAQAYQNQDLEQLQRQAHTLKGTSLNLGLPRLSDVCRKLDLCSKAKQLPPKSLMEELQNAYRSTVAALVELRNQYL